VEVVGNIGRGNDLEEKQVGFGRDGNGRDKVKSVEPGAIDLNEMSLGDLSG
jgi:hypothetical protein